MKITKLLSLILAAFVTTGALAVPGGSNLVYVDQVGSSNTIVIDQIGGLNGVGGLASITPSDTNYATVTGNTNTVTLMQVGLRNTAQYDIRGNSNNYTATVNGNDNVNKLRVGTPGQQGNQNSISEQVLGSNNLIDQTIFANQVISNVVVDGSYTEVVTNLMSDRGQSYITIMGAGTMNRVEVEQTDLAGANGHVARASITDGSHNSVMIQQQGTNDTVVDVRISGDSNTVTVRSSSAVIVNPKTAIPR